MYKYIFFLNSYKFYIINNNNKDNKNKFLVYIITLLLYIE